MHPLVVVSQEELGPNHLPDPAPCPLPPSKAERVLQRLGSPGLHSLSTKYHPMLFVLLTVGGRERWSCHPGAFVPVDEPVPQATTV